MRCWHSDDKSKYIINKGVECLKIKEKYTSVGCEERKSSVMQSYRKQDFLELYFSEGTLTSSIFLTILTGYAEKLITTNFKVLCFS